MLDFVPDEILNTFSIRVKLADLQRRLDNKRTPKKYVEPIQKEIRRYEKLLIERKKNK